MDGLQSQRIELNDFSGGMTDHYVNGRPNCGQVVDNFVVLPDKSLMSRPGSELVDETNPQIPAGNQRVGALINYNNDEKLFVQSAKKLYYRAVTPGAYSTLAGPTANDVFTAGSTSSYISWATWNRHLLLCDSAFSPVMKVLKDSGGTYRCYNLGLPALATSPTVTAGGAGARNYIYGFLHYHTYTIGSEVFEKFGPVTRVSLASSLEPSATNNPVTNIPVLANGVTNNYDTTNVKVYIYRTVNNGTTLYKIGQVNNGITVFTDNVSDAVCDDGLVLYTDGGVLDNDLPPPCKYIHVADKVAIFASIKDGSEERPNTYRISPQDDPDSAPGANESTVARAIMGVSSAVGTRIILTTGPIYRSEGIFDETGRGNIQDVEIHDSAGCLSHRSIVQADGQIFWFGNDGVYNSNGFEVRKISRHLNTSFKSWITNVSDNRKIDGKFDQENRRIIWSIQTDSSSLEVDGCLILDLQWPVTEESTFYTASNGTSWRPTALEFFNKDMYRADSRGYVFRHDTGLVSDPKVDTVATPADWEQKTIIWRWKSISTPLGTTMARKWVTQAILNAKNRGNVSIQINAINDDGVLTRPLKEIRWRRNFTWGDPDFIWGSDTCTWGPAVLIKARRRMPKTGLRLTYIQIEITNAYTIVQRSDTLGTATFNTATKTATLDNAAAFDWPADSVDYYLSQPSDAYTIQYLVTARAANVLTYSDSANSSTSGSQAWLLKGYKKNEVCNILSVGVLFAPILQTPEMYTTAEGGENA